MKERKINKRQVLKAGQIYKLKAQKEGSKELKPRPGCLSLKQDGEP